MTPLAKARLLLVACLAVGIAGPAFAETKSTVHEITKATFVSNCQDMGGEVIDNGGTHAGCDLPSGTSVVCSFEPADSDLQGGVCESETRVARTELKNLLDLPGMSVGAVPESLTSTSSSDGAPASAGPTQSGKGSYAGGAGFGSPAVGDGGPVVK